MDSYQFHVNRIILSILFGQLLSSLGNMSWRYFYKRKKKTLFSSNSVIQMSLDLFFLFPRWIFEVVLFFTNTELQ